MAILKKEGDLPDWLVRSLIPPKATRRDLVSTTGRPPGRAPRAADSPRPGLPGGPGPRRPR